ncbi:hypothetical protein GCM10009557_47430 [Virgisporangium ochraceum]|uniref:Uncharacterized protein n=1 Tax=Virgisporangium ochraceum TaxID=65505 RepID=A0A8J3ZQ26_9ACTN|nr:hypothetical protein [Virgisporangium ochraceum]GIJ66967.1 hypothetical protein Voc01_018840 [Virgisporangium ochraceum]
MTVADTWVPVERRWLGLDRRTLPAAGVVAGLILLWAVVMPVVNRVTPADYPRIGAGDRLDLGGGVTITPPVGWRLVEGYVVGSTRTPASGDAEVGQSGVVASVHVAPFNGDADALLGQAERIDSSALPGFTVSGGRTTVPAQDGITGVVEDYSSGSGEGLVAAYAFDGVGVTVVVDATSGQLAVHAAEIDAMLRSVAGRAGS